MNEACSLTSLANLMDLTRSATPLMKSHQSIEGRTAISVHLISKPVFLDSWMLHFFSKCRDRIFYSFIFILLFFSCCFLLLSPCVYAYDVCVVQEREKSDNKATGMLCIHKVRFSFFLSLLCKGQLAAAGVVSLHPKQDCLITLSVTQVIPF